MSTDPEKQQPSRGEPETGQPWISSALERIYGQAASGHQRVAELQTQDLPKAVERLRGSSSLVARAVAKAQAELSEGDRQLRQLIVEQFEELKIGLQRGLVDAAAERILRDVLADVIDDADRVLAEPPHEQARALHEAMRAMRDKLIGGLSRLGVEPIAVEPGQTLFDVSRHECVGRETLDDVGDGVICGLYKRGYTLNDRVVRPARVIVNGG